MASEDGQLIPLSQLANILGGYAFKGDDLGSAGYRVVKIADIEPPRINLEGCDRIPTTKVHGLDRFKLEDLDVLVAMTGATTGKAGRLRTSEPAYLNQRVAKISALAGKEYDDFIWAIVSQPGFDQLIMQNAHGSAQPNVSAEGIGRILIPQIAPDEQLAIGKFVRLLDDKIELNRRMNVTLEGMARALFQSWFVDFDPVRAKSAGKRPPGLDKPTADLFPAEFEDSELGEIPKGWRVKPVGDVVSCLGGGTPSTADPQFWEGGIHHWTTPKDFSSLASPILIDTERKITPAGVAKISSGLLPTGTVLLSSRAPVGYLAIAAIPVAINQGFIALVPSQGASSEFLLNWCDSVMDTIKARATGTTFAEISKKAFRPIPMIVPTPSIMRAFTAAVRPLYGLIGANLVQSRTLAAVRDALLPKLLSGELRLSEAEKIAGRTVNA